MEFSDMSSADQKEPRESRLAGIIRVIVAIVILIAFFGAIGFSFLPQILISIQGLFNRAQANDAEQIESRYFEVINDSSASLSQVRGVIKMMEAEYETIITFLGREHIKPVPVFIKDGSGQAMLDSNGLVLYYEQGIIDTSTVPFFLVFWLENLSFGSEDIFFSGGFAIYVTEATTPENQFWGQSTDAWVKFLQEENLFLPMEESVQVGLPTDVHSAINFTIGLLEGGAFMRWVSESKGLDVARQIASGVPPEDIFNQPLSEIEASWLDVLNQKELSPKPCRLAAGRTFLSMICDAIDEKNP